jgi:hypothetical protein
MRVGGQQHAPATLPPGKRSGTHFKAGWVGPRPGLYTVLKISPPPGFDPRIVASCYTEYAIPDLILYNENAWNCFGAKTLRRTDVHYTDFTKKKAH